MHLGPYLLGPNSTPENGIYTGDARILPKSIPNESVDVVAIDPPYFLPAQHYAARKKWARSIADLSLIESFYDLIFDECVRVLKNDGGMLIICCDGQSYPVMYVKLYSLFDRLIDIVWDKQQIGLGNGIRRQHEWLLIGLRGKSDFPGWESSVISCSPVPSEKRIHPAEKPVELWLRLFSALVKPGSIVTDWFCGSGSTLEGAYLCGSLFLGFDLDANYANAARNRVANTQPPLPGLVAMKQESFISVGGQ